MTETAFKTNQRYTHTPILTQNPVRIIWQRGLILSPAHHWEPSFVFALFSPQRCKWGWETARQESNHITNMRVILGCVINVVQLYHSSCMTMLSALCSGSPSQATFRELHVGQESVFREYPWWFPDFSRQILNPYPGKTRLLGTLKPVWSFQGVSSMCLQKFPHMWKCRNMGF